MKPLIVWSSAVAVCAIVGVVIISQGPSASATAMAAESGDPPIRSFEELVIAEEISTYEMEFLLSELEATYYWRFHRDLQVSVLDDGGGPLWLVGECRMGDDTIRTWGHTIDENESIIAGGIFHVGTEDAVFELAMPEVEDTQEVTVPPGTLVALGEYFQDPMPKPCGCIDGAYACCWRQGLNVYCDCIGPTDSPPPGGCHAGGPNAQKCWISPKGCYVTDCADGTYPCCNKDPQDGRWYCHCVSEGECHNGGPWHNECGAGYPPGSRAFYGGDEFEVEHVLDVYNVNEL